MSSMIITTIGGFVVRVITLFLGFFLILQILNSFLIITKKKGKIDQVGDNDHG